jgi:hypothetical protein
MTPYRTAQHAEPAGVELDVMRFAVRSCRARRVQKSLALATIALGLVAFVLPAAFSAHGTGTVASAPLYGIAPFDSLPRRTPAVHVVVLGPWTCMPHDPTLPMTSWEREAELGRELYGIDCADTFF